MDYGLEFGVFRTGIDNSITDVDGVKVGHVTLNYGGNIRTGVTAINPHPNDPFRIKTPTAVFIGNGYGKLTGYSQVEELGNSETPIILTNTLSVPTASQALIEYTLKNNNTNIQVDFFSNLPGVQLYSAQNLNYKKKLFPYQGICLETQYFPDAPNKKNFPSTLIKPNKRYTCFTKIKIN